MILEDLLTYIASEYLDDRTELIEGDNDDLWSDTTIVRFLNEAQRILCRRAWVIIENGVSPAGVVTLVTGKTLYPLHKSIIRVFDATPSTQVYPLGRAVDEQLRGYPFNWNVSDWNAFEIGEFASLAGNTDSTSGVPLAIASDAGTRVLRVYPTPSSVQSGLRVSLKIARLPICLLDVNKASESPEVAEEYHMALADYAAGRCLSLPNVGGNARGIGKELLASFDAQVREARRDRQRAEMSPVRFGFSSTTARL